MKIITEKNIHITNVVLLSIVIPIITATAFFSFAGSQSLFLNEWGFFQQTISRPGGLLEYIAQFCSQFLINRIGIVILSTALLSFYLLTVKIFNHTISKRVVPALLSSFLLGSLLGMGEMFYMNVRGGILFSSIFGWMLVVGAIGLQSWKKESLIGATIKSIVSIVAIYAASFYGVLFTAVLLIGLLKETKDSRYGTLLGIFSTIIASGLIVAYTSLYNTFPATAIVATHFKNYPWVLGKYTLICEGVLIIITLLLAFNKELYFKNKIVSGVAYGTSILFICFLAYSNLPYEKRSELMLLAEKEKWSEMSNIAQNNPGASNPLSFMALAQQGTLLDRMFQQLDLKDPNFLLYDPNVQSYVANIEILKRLGNFRGAYQIAFEKMVFSAPSLYLYRELAYLSLLNYDYDLAKKYLTTLSHNWMMKSEAQKWLTLLDTPQTLEAELKNLRRFQSRYSRLSSIYSGIEVYIVNNYAKGDRNPVSLQYAVGSILLLKKVEQLDVWLPEFEKFGFKRIPVHVQEAIAWLAAKSGDMNKYTKYLDNTVSARFNNFVAAAKSSSDPKQIEKAVAPYKNTYWYYLNFAPDLHKLDGNANYDQR